VKLRGVALALAAPVAAAVSALLISSIALLLVGANPLDAFDAMWDYLMTVDSLVAVVNRAIPYYIAGCAVAIGFKMNLFNIGVDGQYRLAALFAAAAGAAIDLPAVLHITVILLVAMAVGGAYAAIPGFLKVSRGVNEVVSTIMLNFVATGLTAYMLVNYFRNDAVQNQAETDPIPLSGRLPTLNWLLELFGFDVPSNARLSGFLPLAILVGVAFYLIIYRTRFGFDLRASGRNPNAARSSGVNPKRMILMTMILSGMIAGLAGMPPLLTEFYKYGDTFPTAIGFTGIAVALLGRNSPAGIAIGAVVWAGIERGSQSLRTVEPPIPQEIGQILQGTLLLTAVIAFEVVRRYRLRLTVEEAAAKTAAERVDQSPLAQGAVG
jgi:simple sugar transport system permease protein